MVCFTIECLTFKLLEWNVLYYISKSKKMDKTLNNTFKFVYFQSIHTKHYTYIQNTNQIYTLPNPTFQLFHIRFLCKFKPTYSEFLISMAHYTNLETDTQKSYLNGKHISYLNGLTKTEANKQKTCCGELVLY